MKTITPTTHTQAIWMSDLHLDKASDVQIRRLLNKLRKTDSDCICISGDISTAQNLDGHLRAIATACSPRPVYFVIGNHDYFGSGMAEVDRNLEILCHSIENLHYLNGEKIIPLSETACLIGYRGLADGRAGFGLRTMLRSPDHRAIRDFHALTHKQSLVLMKEMGLASARKIRRLLPYALKCYRHVILMAHCPPFACSAIYNGRPCSPSHQPHYVDLSAGLAISGIARAYPKRRITILTGHTHKAHEAQVAPNIKVRVAGARTGRPGLIDVLQIS